MKLINKLANILMPIEEIEEPLENMPLQHDSNSGKQQSQTSAEQGTAIPQQNTASVSTSSVRTHLSVHTNNKVADMQILVFKINAFDEVKAVADALKRKKAAVVNYEKVDAETQRRICDFINGACYVMNGAVKRITASMVLYVPENITINNGIVSEADSMFKKDIAS
ncbi:cell division protein SepF [Pectinatus sottacetonis]|uniref:cell division protein SepF n=1 Tax=Pectinatus sottacetonis TaxID=1002795 RepID=UPI0018C66129|nr:cell division protein SepF [Pectinatus sottacetonis]